MSPSSALAASVYRWRGVTLLPERRGDECRIVATTGRGMVPEVTVEFSDGERVTCSRKFLEFSHKGEG